MGLFTGMSPDRLGHITNARIKSVSLVRLQKYPGSGSGSHIFFQSTFIAFPSQLGFPNAEML